MVKPEETREKAWSNGNKLGKIKKVSVILGGASIFIFAVILLSPQKSEAADRFYCSDGRYVNIGDGDTDTIKNVCKTISLFSMAVPENAADFQNPPGDDSPSGPCQLEFSSYAFCLMWNWSHGILALGIVIAAFLWGAATLLFSKQFKGIGIALAVAVVLWIGPRFASETFQAESLQSLMKEEKKSVESLSMQYKLQEEKGEVKKAKEKKRI